MTGSIRLTSFLVVLAAALVLGIVPGTVEGLASNLLIAVMGLLPFVFAVRQNYALQTAERELVAQYQHNARIFTNAKRLLGDAADLPLKQEILRALGEAALEENGQWILRQRERPASAPQALQG